ncbi:MAG: HAD-IIA family hydrolase [Actinomycetales bacterium]
MSAAQPPAQLGLSSAEEPLAGGFDVLLFDLDGVVYVGPEAVPGAAESLSRAARAGLICRFVTNNAARTPQDVAAHLRELGIQADDDQVVTAAQEGAELLASRLPAGSEVLAVGGPGVSAALHEVGLVPVHRTRRGVAGVLQGFGPDVGWRDLAEATYAVRAGADWVATNPDMTVPTPRGTAPGNGQLVGVVARTTGKQPEVTGKPGPGLFTSAARRAGGGRALVIGDRLDTDIGGAGAAGFPSLLVLTGVTGPEQLLGAGRHERPSYLAADLAGLWQSHPPVVQADEWWVCREARARVSGVRLEVVGESGPDPLDGWRCAAVAAWSARDRGAEVDLTASAESLRAWSG